jgi:hypothetical protein
MLGLKYGGEGSEKHYQLAIPFTCPASIQSSIHCLQPKLVEVGVHSLCITGDKRYKVPANGKAHCFAINCMMTAGATGGAEPVHSVGSTWLAATFFSPKNLGCRSQPVLVTLSAGICEWVWGARSDGSH